MPAVPVQRRAGGAALKLGTSELREPRNLETSAPSRLPDSRGGLGGWGRGGGDLAFLRTRGKHAQPYELGSTENELGWGMGWLGCQRSAERAEPAELRERRVIKRADRPKKALLLYMLTSYTRV